MRVKTTYLICFMNIIKTFFVTLLRCASNFSTVHLNTAYSTTYNQDLVIKLLAFFKSFSLQTIDNYHYCYFQFISFLLLLFVFFITIVIIVLFFFTIKQVLYLYHYRDQLRQNKIIKSINHCVYEPYQHLHILEYLTELNNVVVIALFNGNLLLLFITEH